MGLTTSHWRGSARPSRGRGQKGLRHMLPSTRSETVGLNTKHGFITVKCTDTSHCQSPRYGRPTSTTAALAPVTQCVLLSTCCIWISQSSRHTSDRFRSHSSPTPSCPRWLCCFVSSCAGASHGRTARWSGRKLSRPRWLKKARAGGSVTCYSRAKCVDGLLRRENSLAWVRPMITGRGVAVYCTARCGIGEQCMQNEWICTAAMGKALRANHQKRSETGTVDSSLGWGPDGFCWNDAVVGTGTGTKKFGSDVGYVWICALSRSGPGPGPA